MRSFRATLAVFLLGSLLIAWVQAGSARAEPVGWVAELRAADADVVVHDGVAVPGGAVVVGTLDRDGQESAGWMARLRADGSVLWTRVFDASFSTVLIRAGFPAVDSIAPHGVAEHADGSLWVVGHLALQGEPGDRFGFVVIARPDGRLSGFHFEGHGADSLHAIASAPAGLIAVGETVLEGVSRAWVAILTPQEGLVADSVFSDSLAGRMTDVSVTADRRLLMALAVDGDGATHPVRLFELPPVPDRPLDWGASTSVEVQAAADAPDSFIISLGDGHSMLFNPALLETGGHASQIAGFAPGLELVSDGVFSSDETRLQVLDATGGEEAALIVGIRDRADMDPLLWLRSLGPYPADEPSSNLLATEIPQRATLVGSAESGALLAGSFTDGSTRVMALSAPLSDSFDPDAVPETVMLDQVAAFHALCAAELCDRMLRLPRYPDRIGQTAMPFGGADRNQFVRVEGMDVAEDSTLVAAGLDGGQATRHREPWVRAFSAEGSPLWSTVLPQWGSSKPFVRDVVALGDGRVVAAGYASDRVEVDGGPTRAFAAPVWVLDADGTIVATVLVDIAPEPDGRFEDYGLHAAVRLGCLAVVAGGVGGPPVGTDFEHGRGVLAAIDSEGSVAWRLHLPLADGIERTIVLNDVAAAPDGTVVAVGSGIVEVGVPALGYVAVVGADGTLMWESPPDLLAGAYARLNAVAVGSNGTIYLAGDGTFGCRRAADTDVFRNWVAALQPDRSIGWTRCLIDHDVVGIGGMAVSDGRIVVAGYADAPATSGLGGDPVGWIGAVDPADELGVDQVCHVMPEHTGFEAAKAAESKQRTQAV